jgi:hypothetical protein
MTSPLNPLSGKKSGDLRTRDLRKWEFENELNSVKYGKIW